MESNGDRYGDERQNGCKSSGEKSKEVAEKHRVD
jgi:hypothetical protein